FHLLARPRADLTQALAALADDDRLLAVTLDPDHRADAQQRAVHHEALDLDRGGVRQLFAELPHQLLAHQLTGQEPLALVGDLVLRVERWLLGQHREHVLDQRLKPLALERGDRMHGSELAAFTDLREVRQQRGLVLEPIDLVDHQHHRHLGLVQGLVGEGVGLFPLAGAHDQQGDVDALQRTTGGTVHPAMHGGRGRLALVAVQPGGVDQQDLALLEGRDAQQAVAGGLWPWRDDADLGADQRVGQGGLADVGPADDGDVAAAVGGIHRGIVMPGQAASSADSAASAAACSAPRREPPSPSVTSAGWTRVQLTRKVLAWSSPDSATSWYTGSGFWRPCSHSCRRVLASLPTLCGGGRASIAASNHGITTVRQASKPASR